jgi:hypothetical protein
MRVFGLLPGALGMHFFRIAVSCLCCRRCIFIAYDRGMEIRAASPEDAPAACQVMRRSIAELCVADHRNDEAILTRWLSNKTPEVFVSWITQSDNSLLVAAEGGNISLRWAPSPTRARSRLITFRRMRGFAGSAGPCSARSKRGLWSEATLVVPSQAQRLLGASIGPTATSRMACRSVISERIPATQCPSF